MSFDIKTFAMGLLTGLTFGLGIADLVDKDLSVIFETMGSFLSDYAALITSVVAAYALLRWQKQHNYNLISNALDSFSESVVEYERYANKALVNCYYDNDDDFEEFILYERRLSYVNNKVETLLPRHLLSTWKSFFDDPIIDFKNEIAPVLKEATWCKSSDQKEFHRLNHKISDSFHRAHANVVNMYTLIPTVFR